MKLEVHYRQLLSYLLSVASEKFSNFNCNNIPVEIYKDWTLEQKREFLEGYHTWNKSIGYDKDCKLEQLPNDSIMSYLSFILKEEVVLEEVPILIGYLSQKWGMVGYRVAEIGTEVFEYRGLYQFTIYKEDNNSPLIKTFYKENLKEVITWKENE